MPELQFPYQHNRRLRSSYDGSGGGRDVSPDSVMFSIRSSFSLVSSSASASASVERCSSASDVLDHDSLVSNMSLHLSGGFCGSSSARRSDPDPSKKSTVRRNGGPYLIGKKVEKAEAIKEYNDGETDGENQTLYSARSSFSHTLKGTEHQSRKSRSDILVRKSDRRRHASLDLNNQAMNLSSSSPRLGVAKKISVSAHKSDMFPSPGTPNHRPTNANRIQGGFALMPYNNGRTMPSKWEDAERWIISPVAGDGALRPLVQQPQRQQIRSKSGPLGSHGPACSSMYSPAGPSFHGGNVRSFITEPLFSTGENCDNNSFIQYNEDQRNGSFPSLVDPCIARSVSENGCSQDGGLMDAAADTSCNVLRRDMATQMSPESSLDSSPTRSNSSSLSSSIPTIADLQHHNSSKADIRDVQVDNQVSLIRWSKKNRALIAGRGVHDWKNEILEVQSADQEALETIKSLSEVKREEAKITAWENLQKAKADAAILKLEMKLEKKRSSSMDRIMNKLRLAQKKSHEMRETILSNRSPQVARSSHKSISLIKTRHIRSLSGCFTCPAF